MKTLILAGALLSGAIYVWAEDAPTSTKPETHAAAEAPAAPEAGPAPKPAEIVLSRDDQCLADPTVVGDLKAQRDMLLKRNQEFEKREEELKARETALAEQIAKLETLRKEVIGLEDTQKAANEERIAKMVAAVEKMSPKNAALMIVQMEEPIAVDTMSKLSVEKLAKVMNSMEPAKSSRLSMLMAGVRLKNERAPGSSAGGKKP